MYFFFCCFEYYVGSAEYQKILVWHSTQIFSNSYDIKYRHIIFSFGCIKKSYIYIVQRMVNSGRIDRSNIFNTRKPFCRINANKQRVSLALWRMSTSLWYSYNACTTFSPEKALSNYQNIVYKIGLGFKRTDDRPLHPK